jgi:ankyrin repeat protein
LNAAALHGHFDVVNYPVEKEADITIANSNGCTPLHSAADNGHFEMVQFLIVNGADVNSRNLNGYTLLIVDCTKRV